MKNHNEEQKSYLTKLARSLLSTMPLILLGGGNVAVADAPRDGRIGYVLNWKNYAVYETEELAECPDGLNDGPRELYSREFPDDGTVRTVVETQLKLEGRNWHPATDESPFKLHQAQGSIAYGLNLDGEVGPNDFESPQGEQGIDNQLYRAIGCTTNYRTPGSLRHFINVFMWRNNNNRWVIELSEVDDMINDDQVTVTTYRGLDMLLADATGEDYVAGGTQRVDMRWGEEFIQQVQGKIVDGVLITEPIDQIKIPWGSTFNTNGYKIFRGLRFKLNLTPESADGLLAGYEDMEMFHHHVNTTWSTHHQSYGQESSSLRYPVLRQLADGYPDPETGVNTAISMALEVKLTQAYVLHPSEK